jgi:hypothetical protein
LACTKKPAGFNPIQHLPNLKSAKRRKPAGCDTGTISAQPQVPLRCVLKLCSYCQNGAIAHVTHIGIVKISTSLTLTKVLCIPSFSFNLISSNKIIKNLQCNFILPVGYCYIHNLLQWRTIGVGKDQCDLFHLLQQPRVFSASTSTSTSNSWVLSALNKEPFVDVWHYRLA